MMGCKSQTESNPGKLCGNIHMADNTRSRAKSTPSQKKTIENTWKLSAGSPVAIVKLREGTSSLQMNIRYDE